MKRVNDGELMAARVALALCAALLLLGCGARSSVPPSSQPPAFSPPPAQPSETACSEFAKHVCNEFGEKASECEKAQTAARLLSSGACAVAERDYATIVAKLKSARHPCTELADRLCADLGTQTETCTMVAEQTKSFTGERCEMMLGHFEEIIAELRAMEQGNRPLTREMQDKIQAADAPSLGRKDAPVVLVVFSDFECPYCQKASKTVAEAFAKYPGKVRLVFRQFPLSMHKNANGAAQAAMAAMEQGKFWEYSDLLFADQQALGRDQYLDYAKRLKLNTKRFSSALDNEKTQKRIDADIALGTSVNVKGTPTVFINGTRCANPTSIESLSKDIEAALGTAPK